MNATATRLPFSCMDDIKAGLRKASEQTLPADERRGVYPTAEPRRLTATSKPSMPGIKGGQGRSGVEVENDARALVILCAMAGAAVLGIACAECIARLTLTAGRLLAPLF